jgi:hypothetical protein
MRKVQTHHQRVGEIVVDETTHWVMADLPGPGNAPHRYLVDQGVMGPLNLQFQSGGIKEVGVNGVTNEQLLAVVIDRLSGFQSGPYACEANQRALEHCLEALNGLKARTRERMDRGVEGKQIV